MDALFRNATLRKPWTHFVSALMPCSRPRSFRWKRRSLCQTGPLPKIAGSTSSSSQRLTTQSHTPNESDGDSQPLAKKIRSLPLTGAEVRLRNGTSRMTNFSRLQSWLDSLMVRAILRSRNFVLVSSPIPTSIPTRLRAKRAMTTPVS